MYQRLSSRVQKVISIANEIAREYGQDYVGTEHVLLAICREGTGVGSRVLTDRGLDEPRVKAEVDRLMKASMEDTWVFGRLPGSPHFRNVVAIAVEQADAMKSSEVCTEHMLLALLLEEGSVASNALNALGVKIEEVRQAVLAGTSKPE
jgi:ATP-dependent Clp protease ATP-binding subunit ClpC